MEGHHLEGTLYLEQSLRKKLTKPNEKKGPGGNASFEFGLGGGRYDNYVIKPCAQARQVRAKGRNHLRFAKGDV